MKNQKNHDYFVGLDIGTNSIGYAATDKNYQLLKYQQHPVWGVHLFESANPAADRRPYRTARRRLDRRQQRIRLLRELFAREIGTVDPRFFQRIDSSSLKKTEDDSGFAVFDDPDYTDVDFHRQYPTIHHLISELIDSREPHDVRLVYLACAWMLAHRGHFFSDVAKEKVEELICFSTVYQELADYAADHGFHFSWQHLPLGTDIIGDILKSSENKTAKSKKLTSTLQVKKSGAADSEDDAPWIDEYEFLLLLCGRESKAAKLFPSSAYTDLKLSLDADDQKTAEMLAELSDDDATLLLLMKKVFDWSVLTDIIGDGKNISDSKVKVYEKHKADLKQLKYLVKKYLPRQEYQDIFRSPKSDKNYTAYCGAGQKKNADQEIFYKHLKSKLDKMAIEDIADREIHDRIMQDIEAEKFLPKQVVSDNRTIPYQLYWNELSQLLTSASGYLPFLRQVDEDGLSVKDKILSIMEFRVPYFVGPLNAHSQFAWIKRKADGRILPWNFNQKVDLDASEEAFIKRMINNCTYLPDEPVLPKHSLTYQRFEVLNMLNPLHVNGAPITVEIKQQLFALFYQYSRVSKKTILNYLKSNNIYQDINENSLTGIDDTITATLSSWRIFVPLIRDKKLTAEDAEAIINRRSFTEDRGRFVKYLKQYPALSDADRKMIAAKNFQGFGRLSAKFLTQPGYSDPRTGNKLSISSMMWEYNLNLQQLMSAEYPFARMVSDANREYYAQHPQTLTERLDNMYVSNAVKRPIIRSLTVLDEITRTMGGAPRKIFVEMARDVTGGKEKKRTVSRLAQIQSLYQQLADEDTRQLNTELARYDEAALQKDTLYLYFMQLGKDMYTGKPITDLSLCNKEHIYPQSKVKDDSVQNNLVLVHSNINGEKSDSYPLSGSIRQQMTPFWQKLLANNLITREKYFRLTRSTPFSADEQWGFINRQLVETRQTTKVITELLKERYPKSEIVYVKAGLVSDFRHDFDLLKSRTVNDLHHAKDAYLNVIVGNVWHEYFTRKWFDTITKQYTIKQKKLFAGELKNCRGETIWQGAADIARTRAALKRNYIHQTSYTYCQHGGLFDQNPVAAAAGMIPLKKGKPTEIYGGYNKPAATFFVFALTEETANKKSKKELTLVPVDLMVADKILKEEDFAVSYVKNFIDPAAKKSLSVQFPLGLKPIKIKTVFEVDNGLRFRLNGKSNGGKTIIVSMFSPLLLDSHWENYIKRLDAFCEKKRSMSGLTYSEEYDKFSAPENLRLYDILLAKLQAGPFANRPANPQDCLAKGREIFADLPPEKQAPILLGIIQALGKGSGAGVDLTAVGGVAKAAVTTISSSFSNWKKNFHTVRLVYSDSSGLHETKSINLLDLI